MGDDGLGLAALARLREDWECSPDVQLVDGGTWGLTLLPIIEDATRVLLLDAINIGAPAGSEVALTRDRLPRYLSTKVSPHQIDLRDVLALAELRGTLPADTVALGLQPARIELSDHLSGALAARLDDLVRAAVRLLATWGYECTPKAGARRA